MPFLCKVLGLPRYTNNSLRPTAIRQLKRSGAEDREVMNITGHQSIKTLSNYHLAPSVERKRKLAVAISTGNRKMTKSADETEADVQHSPEILPKPLPKNLPQSSAKSFPQSLLSPQPSTSKNSSLLDTLNDSFNETMLVYEDELNVIEVPDISKVEVIAVEKKVAKGKKEQHNAAAIE